VIDTVADWVAEHRTDRPIAYLIDHRSATIAELADVAGVSLERIVAHMGGLHDYGIVTRYGDKPWSRVRWDYDQRRRWDQKRDAREGH